MSRVLGKAIARFKRFHGRAPQKLTHIQFTAPKSVTFLGTVHTITYESTKKLYGTHHARLYTHRMGSGVKIFLHPDGRTLLIKGGRFRVTDWMRG